MIYDDIMADLKDDKKSRTRTIIILASTILIGVTFLLSSTGKVFGFEEVSSQIVDFISYITPDALLTPATVYFLFNIFIPYIFPWIEFVLGCLLIIGFVPRLIAVLCLPIISAFIGTNIWAITTGGYTTCANCFGMWENIFGSLTPVQALVYDIVLVILSILIIAFHPGSFLSSRKWLGDFACKQKPRVKALIGELIERGKRLRYVFLPTRDFSETDKTKVFLKSTKITVLAGLCMLCIVLIVCGSIIFFTTKNTNELRHTDIRISDIVVEEISENSCTISWVSDKPTISSIQLYKDQGIFFMIYTEKISSINHSIRINHLTPDTMYYFHVLADGIPDYHMVSKDYSFTTLSVDMNLPVISDVRVCYKGKTEITITWTTDKPATSEVDYWIAGSMDRITFQKDELSTSHVINLTELGSDVTYKFQVKSTDANENQAISEFVGTFTLKVGTEVGMRAPDFTLQSIDGEVVTLSDYHGKCIMLNFWMTSCSGCRNKIQIIQEAYTRTAWGNNKLLNIHIKGKEAIIENWALSSGITMPILLDMGAEVSDLYNITHVPTTFFLDPNGIIQEINPDFNSPEDLDNLLKEILGKNNL